jgi:hypothetical protein
MQRDESLKGRFKARSKMQRDEALKGRAFKARRKMLREICGFSR